MRSILVVPMVSEGLAFGTIVVASKLEGTFGYREQALLELLAVEIAPAAAISRSNDEDFDTQLTLWESEDRFRVFVEHAADPIFVVDHDGNFVDVNDAVSTVLGYSRKELLTMAVPDISVGVTPQAQRQSWERLHRGEVLTGQAEHQRKDASTFPVELHVSLIELGGQEYKLVIARDTTQRKLDEDIQRRLTEENLVMAELGRIISSSLDIDEVYERFTVGSCPWQ